MRRTRAAAGRSARARSAARRSSRSRRGRGPSAARARPRCPRARRSRPRAGSSALARHARASELAHPRLSADADGEAAAPEVASSTSIIAFRLRSAGHAEGHLDRRHGAPTIATPGPSAGEPARGRGSRALIARAGPGLPLRLAGDAPMRVAVISDIHANRHALEAVLAAVDAEAPDEIWCLGDVVGYGPEPNRCCALVRRARRASASPATTTSPSPARSRLDEFNGDAAAAVRWTRQAIDEPSLAFLRGLAPQARARRTSSSSTAARSTRSGTTSSASRRRCRSFEATLGRRSCSSATATSRSRSPSTAGRVAGGLAPPTSSVAARRRALPAQPGLGRPAARQGSARRLAAARPRRRDGARSAAPTTRSRATQEEIRAARPARGARRPARARRLASAWRARRRAERRRLAEAEALAGERELHLLARLEDPPLDGRERDLERVGDLE